jgi:hypothetical protein
VTDIRTCAKDAAEKASIIKASKNERTLIIVRIVVPLAGSSFA